MVSPIERIALPVGLVFRSNAVLRMVMGAYQAKIAPPWFVAVQLVKRQESITRFELSLTRNAPAIGALHELKVVRRMIGAGAPTPTPSLYHAPPSPKAA